MAAFVDDFDGAAGQWIRERTGWAHLGGYYDALQTDGSGNMGVAARSNDGRAISHETGATSHYAEVVVGTGFLADALGEVGLAVAVVDGTNQLNLYYRPSETMFMVLINDSSVLETAQSALVAGDTITFAYQASGNVFEVSRNGTLVMSGNASSYAAVLAGATKTGITLTYGSSAARTDVFRSFKSDVYAGPPDVTAPILTNATGTSTGYTTANGSVSTDEANGTLYYIATGNASESAATVKAGQSQAVIAAGVQSVSLTGLSPGTTYRIHYLHRDAAGNDSAVLSSGTFTTDAPDVTGPTLTTPTASATGAATATGSVTTNEANGALYYLASTNETETVATVKASGASVPVSVTGVQGVSVSGLSASTTYYLHFVHSDAAGNDSTRVSSPAFTTAASPSTPTLTLTQLRNNAGTLLANETGTTVHVYEVASGNKVATLTGRTTDAAGTLLAPSNAMTVGTEYRVVVVLASGAEGLQKVTATV
ncbi:hypothetical protein [Alicycliphilus denitrificans]|uniref:hypothetical protein n=1 Tax=Alicycliphilus denitrificans TaxID=179636 RepID=UPI0001DA0B38|nr:hypothetical protein [Alicycliphilus denitrificans]ADV01256.1 hypothetical protein Alide_3538 [Alicycliphilus denitrificans BC]